jgi:glycerate 2-kinase
MLTAALAVLPTPPAQAMCVLPGADADVPAYVDLHVGGHPVPNESSVAAGRAALALAAATAPADVLLVLLSGGASALLAAPAEGVTLADKQQTTTILLRAGVDIHALNAVRKHLSRIKGGRLAVAAAARTVCLAISDVVGDDPSVIGSGPTVGDATTFADALAVLDRFGGRPAYPPAAVARLERGARTGDDESPQPSAPALARAETHVLAGRLDALRGAHEAARRLGYEVVEIEEPVVGEARDAALICLAHAWQAARVRRGPLCVLSAGETTVTVKGSGRGGRNQEFALACVPALAAHARPTVVLSVGTDGIDGPTDAAGAFADSSTWDRARAAGLGVPGTFLAHNDAYHFFAPLGDLVVTGPTGTNVGDIQMVLMAACPESEIQ